MEKYPGPAYNVIWHIALWAGYFIFEYLLAWGYVGVMPQIMSSLAHFTVNIVLFYVLYKITFPRLSWSNPKSIAISAALILLVASIFVAMKVVVDMLLMLGTGHEIGQKLFSMQSITGYFYRSAAFAFPAIGIYNLLRFEKEKQNKLLFIQSQYNKMLEDQITQGLLDRHKGTMLNDHIDYHFFFSMMSFISSRLIKTDQIGRQVINQFVDVLRYTTSTKSAATMLRLSDELDQLSIRLELKNIIASQPIYLKISRPGIDYIIPKSLLMPLFITLLKNCEFTGEKLVPTLSVKETDQMLSIIFENLKAHFLSAELKTEFASLDAYLKGRFKEKGHLRYEHRGKNLFVELRFPALRSK